MQVQTFICLNQTFPIKIWLGKYTLQGNKHEICKRIEERYVVSKFDTFICTFFGSQPALNGGPLEFSWV